MLSHVEAVLPTAFYHVAPVHVRKASIGPHSSSCALKPENLIGRIRRIGKQLEVVPNKSVNQRMCITKAQLFPPIQGKVMHQNKTRVRSLDALNFQLLGGFTSGL